MAIMSGGWLFGFGCSATLPPTGHSSRQVKYSQPMSAGNSSFPENRVVPPVRPVPAPSACCGDREEGAGEALLAGSHIPGGVALLQVTLEGGASCRQPPSKCRLTQQS